MDKICKTPEDVKKHLENFKISYKEYDHPPVKTVEELMDGAHFDHSPFIKNLFFVDKKENYYLILANNTTKVEKGLWK